MGKVYTSKNKWFNDDGLIKHKSGKINWGANISKSIEFQCFEYRGYYTIVDITTIEDKTIKRGYIIYFDNDVGNKYVVNSQVLAQVNFSYILGILSNDFLYDIGDIVNNQFLVLDREHKKYSPNDKSITKRYKCKCLRDEYIFEIHESGLKKLKKCMVCQGRVVIKGINDMATTRPEIVKFLKNKEDAHKYTGWSGKNIEFQCNICGREFNVAPCCFSYNFPCGCHSSDSYPNRLIQEVFNQLKIPYIRELRKKHFKWCGKYRYDLYFELNNTSYIVEMDGWFHNHRIEKLEIDKIKDDLAFKNGVNVIRVDCDYPKTKNRLHYIKNNLFNSKLSAIINLHDVNWDVIDEKLSNDTMTKKICDLRNQGFSINDIMNSFNICNVTVDDHLKIGESNGLLNNWAKSGHKTISKVYEIINLENREIQYCVGTRNFFDNSKKYVGIKINDYFINKHMVNNHVLVNDYEINKMSYYDYLVKTAQV